MIEENSYLSPPGETFDGHFFDNFVLDSLKKNSPEFLIRIQKRAFLHLDDGRRYLADREIQADNITRLSLLVYGSDLAPADF
jgi:hypothetical protein